MTGRNAEDEGLLAALVADGKSSSEKTTEGDGERWSRLMAQGQGGDREAYRCLVDELYAAVRRYVGRMLRDPTAADDCTQEVLLALHRARHTYDARRPFRPWLYSIARRKVYDVARQRERRRESDLHDDLADAAVEVEPATRVDLERLLARLPPRYREAIVLTKLEGLAGREAAIAIGVTQITLRTRVHRGLKLLAELAEP